MTLDEAIEADAADDMNMLATKLHMAFQCAVRLRGRGVPLLKLGIDPAEIKRLRDSAERVYTAPRQRPVRAVCRGDSVMNEKEEKAYILGSKAAFRHMLSVVACMRTESVHVGSTWPSAPMSSPGSAKSARSTAITNGVTDITSAT